MKGDKIPDQDHITRYCKPSQAPDGNIQPSAFMLRVNEESLSVNWLGYLNCINRESEIAAVREIYKAKFKVGATAKIVVLNVGEVRQKVLNETPDRRNLDVLHDPLTDDASHSGIYNLKQDNELIAELILETVRDICSVRE